MPSRETRAQLFVGVPLSGVRLYNTRGQGGLPVPPPVSLPVFKSLPVVLLIVWIPSGVWTPLPLYLKDPLFYHQL